VGAGLEVDYFASLAFLISQGQTLLGVLSDRFYGVERSQGDRVPLSDLSRRASSTSTEARWRLIWQSQSGLGGVLFDRDVW
jgi:hypothetical protein